MSPELLALLSAIGNCHTQLQNHAIRLRDRALVREVKHLCDMPALDTAFRVQEFVDAELVSGDAISWGLEVTFTLDDVTVEADVRRVHSQGQDLLVSIAEGTYTTSDAARALPGITQKLCSAVPI